MLVCDSERGFAMKIINNQGTDNQEPELVIPINRDLNTIESIFSSLSCDLQGYDADLEESFEHGDYNHCMKIISKFSDTLSDMLTVIVAASLSSKTGDTNNTQDTNSEEQEQ